MSLELPGIFPPMYFHLNSSWFVLPSEAVRTMKPSWWGGSRLFCPFFLGLRAAHHTWDHATLVLPVSEVHFPGSVISNDCQYSQASSSVRSQITTLEHRLRMGCVSSFSIINTLESITRKYMCPILVVQNLPYLWKVSYSWAACAAH